jgi:hypothetical protein
METLSFQAPEEMKANAEYLEEIEDYMEAKEYMASKYTPGNNISLDAIKHKYKLED